MKTTASFLTAVLAASSLAAATLEMKPDAYLNLNYAHRHGRHKILELGDSSAILSASRRAAGFALLASDRDGDGELTVKFRLLFPDGSAQPLGDAVPVKLRKDRMLARNLVLTLDDADIARLMKSESKFNLVPVRVQAEFTGSDGKPLPALNDVAAIGFDRGLKPQSPEVSVAENGVTGVPTLAINGNLYPGIFGYVGWNWGTARRTVRELGEASRHLYEIVFQPWSLWKEGKFDDAAFERTLNSQVASIVAQDPEALIFVRWWLYMPRDWAKHNPGESIVYDDGSTEIPLLGGPWAHASYASKAWLSAYTKIVDTAVRKLSAGSYADRIFMVRVGYGNCGEWNNFGYHQEKFPGFSPQMLDAYRTWLKQRYGSIDRLNAAWHTALSGFGAVAIPTREERLAGKEGDILRNPADTGNVRDFYRFFSEFTVSLIEHFGRAVKAASGNRLLYGVFYGYYTHHLSGFPYHMLDSGHYALRRLLDSPYVDTLCSPYSYNDRNRGSTLGMPLESIKAHGKLFLAEMDLPTHLADPKRYQADANSGLRFAQAEEQTLTLYRRDFGRVLTWGVGGYWYDFAHNWYHFDRFREFAAATEKINREAAGRDLRSVAEVAVILDEESVFDLSLHAGKWGAELRDALSFDIERLGVPVDFRLSSDLGRAVKRGYRLLVFPAQFRQNPAIREALAAFPGHVLFLYGAGMVSAENRLAVPNDFYGVPVTTADAVNRLTAGERRFYWSGPRPPAEVWKAVLKQAKVHRYASRDETYIYANASYLGIWVPASDGGTLTVTLPEAARITDAETGEPLGGGPEFRFTLPEKGMYFRLLRREAR